MTEFRLAESTTEIHPGSHVLKYFKTPGDAKHFVLRASNLRGLCPAILDHEDDWVKLAWVNGDNLAGDELTSRVFTDFLDWCDEHLWHVTHHDPSIAERHYRDATRDRTGHEMSVDWDTFLRQTQLVKPWHGDLSFENVIITDGSFALLDHRPTFGDQMEWGDVYYDLAKLHKSLMFEHAVVNGERFARTNVPELAVTLHLWMASRNYSWHHMLKCSAIIHARMAPLHPNQTNWLESRSKELLA